jgi:hypothetical protein
MDQTAVDRTKRFYKIQDMLRARLTVSSRERLRPAGFASTISGANEMMEFSEIANNFQAHLKACPTP